MLISSSIFNSVSIFLKSSYCEFKISIRLSLNCSGVIPILTNASSKVKSFLLAITSSCSLIVESNNVEELCSLYPLSESKILKPTICLLFGSSLIDDSSLIRSNSVIIDVVKTSTISGVNVIESPLPNRSTALVTGKPIKSPVLEASNTLNKEGDKAVLIVFPLPSIVSTKATFPDFVFTSEVYELIKVNANS